MSEKRYKEGYHNEWPCIIRSDGEAIDDFVGEMNGLHDQLQQSEARVRELEERLKRSRDAVEHEKKNNRNYAKEISAKDKSINGLEKEVNRIRQRALKAESDLSPVRDSLNNLTAEYSKLKRKLKRQSNNRLTTK